MNNLLYYVQEGGWSMYPIACFLLLGGMLGLGALASLFASTRKLPIGIGLAALMVGLMALGMGLLGTMQGRAATEDAIVNADPEFAERLRVVGYEEADNNLVFGGIACVIPLLTGMLAVARGVTMKATEKR